MPPLSPRRAGTCHRIALLAVPTHSALQPPHRALQPPAPLPLLQSRDATGLVLDKRGVQLLVTANDAAGDMSVEKLALRAFVT